jgi:hypothetical protein
VGVFSAKKIKEQPLKRTPLLIVDVCFLFGFLFEENLSGKNQI